MKPSTILWLFLYCFDWIHSILAKVEDCFLPLPLVCFLVVALCRLGSLRDLHKVPPLMSEFHVFG